MNKHVLTPYKNRIFIETGFEVGSGVDAALENGFEEIHSIEINKDFYEKGIEMYQDNPKVHLYFGDSRTELPKILEKINEPATFWLDAHTQIDSPILEELKALQEHPIKNNIIMIDDCCNFKDKMGCIEFYTIVKEVQKINLNYKMQLIHGNLSPPSHPQNILVAKE